MFYQTSEKMPCLQIEMDGITGDNHGWTWNEHSSLDSIQVGTVMISRDQLRYCMEKTIRSIQPNATTYNQTRALSGPVYLLENDMGQIDVPLYCVSVVAEQDAWHLTLTLFQLSHVKTVVLSATNEYHATSLSSLLVRDDYDLDLIFICLPSPTVYQVYKHALASCGNLKVSVALFSQVTVMSVARYLCTLKMANVGIMNVSNRETVEEGWVGKDVLQHHVQTGDVFAQTTLVLQNKAINPMAWRMPLKVLS